MKIDKNTKLEDILLIFPKQAFEWVKTGHWTCREFTSWLAVREIHNGRKMAEDLISALDDVQDWKGTLVGDLMDELMGYSKE